MLLQVSKDAKECMQECVSEFISFITSEYPPVVNMYVCMHCVKYVWCLCVCICVYTCVCCVCVCVCVCVTCDLVVNDS